MLLQSIFYVIAIIAFLLLIVLLLVSISFIIFLKNIVNNAQNAVIKKVVEYTKPVDVLKELTLSVLGNFFMKSKDNNR